MSAPCELLGRPSLARGEAASDDLQATACSASNKSRPAPCGACPGGEHEVADAALALQAEALALRAADVKVNADGTATENVRRGKGGKQRVVTLAAPGVADSTAWLDVRSRRVPEGRTSPLFCTHASGATMTPGQPLDTGYARAMLARVAAKADLGKRVHLHGLRHGHASYLHHRGVPLAAIQVQLGHSSPLTTVRYLASIGAHDAHAHVAAAFTATA